MAFVTMVLDKVPKGISLSYKINQFFFSDALISWVLPFAGLTTS